MNLPTYLWICQPCKKEWDIVTSMDRRNDPCNCPSCGFPGTRQEMVRTHVHGSASDWNKQDWNPALGCYTKSNKHARDIAKSRGLEEVGTEKPENIHKYFDKKREDRRAERWAECDREKLYED